MTAGSGHASFLLTFANVLGKMKPPSRANDQIMRLPTWITDVVLLKLLTSCMVETHATAALEPVDVSMMVR